MKAMKTSGVLRKHKLRILKLNLKMVTIGTVKNKVSTSKSRTLEYNENDASLSSFNGNYKTISSADTLSEYEYDLPQ